MRKKIKKINKSTALINNEFGVILEEINSNLKLVLEDHTGLDKKIDENHKEFQEFREDVNFKFDGIDKRFNGIDSNFKTVFKYLSKIDDEIQLIKSELKKKPDFSHLKTLEKRIKKLEINYTELHSLVLQKCG